MKLYEFVGDERRAASRAVPPCVCSLLMGHLEEAAVAIARALQALRECGDTWYVASGTNYQGADVPRIAAIFRPATSSSHKRLRPSRPWGMRWELLRYCLIWRSQSLPRVIRSRRCASYAMRWSSICAERMPRALRSTTSTARSIGSPLATSRVRGNRRGREYVSRGRLKTRRTSQLRSALLPYLRRFGGDRERGARFARLRRRTI